jgi:ACGX-repeat protein
MNNLEMLDSWKGDSVFSAKRSAQSYFGANQTVMASSGACGSACGAGDDGKPKPKPTACGSACGAGDDNKPKLNPTACGSACGAGDDNKPKPKPTA